MTIIESVMFADFGDLTSPDCDLRTLKPRKNGQFFSKISQFVNLYKVAKCATLKFEHSVNGDDGYIRIKCGGAQSRDCDFRGRNLEKSEQFGTGIISR